MPKCKYRMPEHVKVQTMQIVQDSKHMITKVNLVAFELYIHDVLAWKLVHCDVNNDLFVIKWKIESVNTFCHNICFSYQTAL